MEKCDILMVIPLMEEFKAIKDIANVTNLERKGTIYYYKVEFPHLDYDIVTIVLGKPGINNASSMTGEAIEFCKPDVIVLMGIAGGLRKEDIDIGDVVVGDKINEFMMDSKAESRDGSYTLRFSGDSSDVFPVLVSFATHFSNRNPDKYANWQHQAKIFREKNFPPRVGIDDLSLPNLPKMSVGRIASGDTVGASKAYVTEIVLHADRKHLALEMEAAGVAMAAKRRENPIPVLVMRGISDLADEHKKDIFRKYALFNVINLLNIFLSSEDFRDLGIIHRKITVTKKIKVQLVLDIDIGILNSTFKEILITTLAALLKVDKDEICLLQVSGGSIVFDLEMSVIAANRLLDLFIRRDFRILELGQMLTSNKIKHYPWKSITIQGMETSFIRAKKNEVGDQHNTISFDESQNLVKISFDSENLELFLLNRMEQIRDLFTRQLEKELINHMDKYFPSPQNNIAESKNYLAILYFSQEVSEFERILKELRELHVQKPNYLSDSLRQRVKDQIRDAEKHTELTLDLMNATLSQEHYPLAENVKKASLDAITYIEDVKSAMYEGQINSIWRHLLILISGMQVYETYLSELQSYLQKILKQ